MKEELRPITAHVPLLSLLLLLLLLTCIGSKIDPGALLDRICENKNEKEHTITGAYDNILPGISGPSKLFGCLTVCTPEYSEAPVSNCRPIPVHPELSYMDCDAFEYPFDSHGDLSLPGPDSTNPIAILVVAGCVLNSTEQWSPVACHGRQGKFEVESHQFHNPRPGAEHRWTPESTGFGEGGH